MTPRLKNYIIVAFLLVIFVVSLVSIRYFYQKSEKNIDKESSNDETNIYRFIFPASSMTSFFLGCYFISIIVTQGEHNLMDKYSGIFYLLLIGIILLIMNSTILNGEFIREYIKGKKFSYLGVIMALGIGAIVFGFIDNFGMKLGTEALDDLFLHAFLGPFSEDRRFVDHKDSIKDNLAIMNEWVNSDWRKVMNHTLRFKDDIAKNSKFNDLTNAINQFGGDKLNIPNSILKNRNITNNYVDNLRSQYDVIDGSKSMLGNTFSNFCAGLLGAGIVNLFTYMTGYDGAFTGDSDIDDSTIISNIDSVAPILEALFITVGCLVPVFLNIAMKRGNYNYNNFYAWLIVGVIGLLILVMMYFSVTGIKNMNTNDKKNSIKKTLGALQIRLDINEKYGRKDKELLSKISTFVNSL